MDDLISKQEAIDEIRSFQNQVTLSSSSDWIGGMDEGFGHTVNVIELMDTVEAIPVEWLENFRDSLDMLSENQLMRAIDLIIDAYRAEKKREKEWKN